MEMHLSKFWQLVMDKEAWHTAVHEVSKSRTRLSDWSDLKKLFLQLYAMVLNIIISKVVSNTDFSFHTQSCCCLVAKSSVTLCCPWTATCQSSCLLELFKLMSIESVMSSNHLSFCHLFSSCPQSFPASGSFPMNQFFASGSQSIGVSALASVLPRLISFKIGGFVLLAVQGILKAHL